MIHNWTTTWVIASAVLVSVAGIIVWKKKRQSFVPVGKIKKLFFYPVKSLKAIEVDHGICTKFGFVANGLLDRSFMVVDGTGKLVSQREAPTLVLLTPKVTDKTLSIVSTNGKELKVKIKDSVSSKDKIVHCLVHTDSIDGVDCGDEAALFLQSFLSLPDVRLVQHLPSLPDRKFLKNDPFFKKIKKQHPIAFQDLAAFHLLSQGSIDDLNTELKEIKISELNFRPNIVVDSSKPYFEDSWDCVRFESGAELFQIMPTTRCIMTTNDPNSGILTKKDPLVTMRKYRIPKSPDMLKKTGPIPCMGVSFAVLKTGSIRVGEDIVAHIGQQLEVVRK